MSENATQKIGIIIPSFNDPRIVRSIYSVTKRDPHNLTRLYIIDGGSKSHVADLIRAHIRPHDYFCSEKDGGIFDALNKGLDALQEPIIGWLGSDDCFSSAVDFSAIADAFDSEDIDCYLFDLIFTNGSRSIRRSKVSRPTPLGLRFGLHPLHFSSFWRTSTVGNTRFNLNFPISADQEFYCRMTWPTPVKAKVSHEIVTIALAGGNSSKDIRRIVIANLEVYKIFRQFMGPVNAVFATTCKVGRKIVNQLFHTPFPIETEMIDLITKL